MPNGCSDSTALAKSRSEETPGESSGRGDLTDLLAASELSLGFA